MNHEHKISAVIITLNEEKKIGRCLESLLPVADEIVVVDSFSTDKTKEICTEFGVRFIEHPFEGHVQQKNFALSLAMNELVLSLDADELLSKQLQQSILRVKKEANPADAYTMNRLTNYCGRWIRYSGWYPDTKLRLWKKNQGHWGGTNPHDRVIFTGLSKSHLDGDLLHYSYDSITQHVRQLNYFTDLAASNSKKNNKLSQFFIIKIAVAPPWAFFKRYVLNLGLLDGYYGLVIAVMTSYYKFLKYIKIKELYNSKK